MPSPWHRLAGLNGAAAVGLSAFGAHGLPKQLRREGLDDEAIARSQKIWDTSARMHLMHSIALAVVPTLKRPNLSGALLASGMAAFCGPCYLLAAKPADFPDAGRMAPAGGFLLIGGWLSLVF